MIHFTCPCGKSLHARDEYAGQTTRCPDCGREIDIPGERVQTADAPRARGRRPDEGVRRPHADRPDGADWEDRPRPPTTSGMAVTSAILGVLSLFLCSVFTGLPAILLGALGLRDIGRGQGRVQGKGLAITGLVTGVLSILLLPGLLILLLIPAVGRVRDASNKVESANNLKEISFGMQDYASVYQTLPPAAICDANGTPLLSWRVAILPYVEQENLYVQFKLDEPWDGPNNSRLVSMMPKLYALPGDTTAPPGYTYYRVFVGNHAAFDWQKGAHMPADFPDGLSNTILVVEAATAAPWTKPDELPYDPNAPLPPLGGHYTGGFQAMMADGEIHWISTGVSQSTLRNAITRDDGMPLSPDW